MIKIKSWSDTLTEFLLSSNEDERVVALFKENILEVMANAITSNVFNWLEVGAGNGNKTQMVANLIDGLNQFEKINLTICEPSIDWLVALKNTDFAIKLSSKVKLDFYNKSIEQLINSNEKINYDFISIIQVMYSSTIKEAILQIVENKSVLKPTMIWVDVEDKSGDFYKIRKLVNQKIKVDVHSFAEELIQGLKYRKVKFKTFLTKNKIYKINVNQILEDDNHWLFPFILGYNIEEFSQMENFDKIVLRQIVRQYVSKIKNNQLNIPDISILIFCE